MGDDDDGTREACAGMANPRQHAGDATKKKGASWLRMRERAWGFVCVEYEGLRDLGNLYVLCRFGMLRDNL